MDWGTIVKNAVFLIDIGLLTACALFCAHLSISAAGLSASQDNTGS